MVTLSAVLASADEFQRLAAGRAQADVPAFGAGRNLLRAGNRHRSFRRPERAIDLAGHGAIGRVVGLDDHGILRRRHRAGVGQGRQRRQCGSGDQQYPDPTMHRLSPETDRDAHQNRNGRGWQRHPRRGEKLWRPFSGLTSNDGANSGGASPNACDASPSGGDASPSASGASPNDDGANPSDGGPSRDGGHDPTHDGPSALLPASADRPHHPK